MNEITLHRADPADMAVMPVMDLATAGERYNAMVAFVKGLMHADSDYGVIPGTNGKPVLLKPGAEKLCTFFGLSKRFVLAQSIEDWDGTDHGGEPMFYYLYRCQLWRGDLLVAEADGSCNSRESKYRWRKGERVCPNCGQATIIKGKAEYGGGWVCFAKKGGCGTKFPDGAPAIESQEVGRVPNPDVADLVNTIQKMAQKRALIAATLLAVNASEFFTQDMEDFVDAEVVSRPSSNGNGGSPRPPHSHAPQQEPVLDRTMPMWWERQYARCTTMEQVEKVDTLLSQASEACQTHTLVASARSQAVAEISRAAIQLGDETVMAQVVEAEAA